MKRRDFCAGLGLGAAAFGTERLALREPPLDLLPVESLWVERGAVSTVEPQGPESRRAGIEGRIERRKAPRGDPGDSLRSSPGFNGKRRRRGRGRAAERGPRGVAVVRADEPRIDETVPVELQRWDRPNAEAVMALATLEHSHLWNRNWTLQQRHAA